MPFLIEDDDLFEKYENIWDNVSAGIKKELRKTKIKTKIKLYGDEVADF